ncbi:glycosyl hydrolase family 18 protein [Papillibacter cinnamivorans]|uniref:S-layer homology domain-containing protein n=1 Tax=Papillibacter cinnamivorans DSM 12816 TaxID=1122930 RepID=A0A1W2A292_9FIRM|nr:glycosyl hydrolase family 18 protein [Papillibacter cinnamivorans]SMC54551.1 S-layer homology domain-containing protein [Papillibacter cinnamivorans DSM 12816]
MKGKIIALLLAGALCLGLLPGTALAAVAGFTDVPDGHWAEASITEAVQQGLVKGIGGNKFGLGIKITRGEFALLMCRMMGWDLVTPASGSYDDNQDTTAWYYSAVETAYLNGAVTAENKNFRPRDAITREEMAVMLVRALGYTVLSGVVQDYGLPFKDVSTNKGYITIAYDIGMTKGTTSVTFSPRQTASREEAITMLMRVYDKYASKITWLHGFYAISSYSQKELAADMDAVSLGWSRMEYSAGTGAWLNTTGSDSNEYKIPSGYTLATDYFKQEGVPANLSVYMDTSRKVTLSDGTQTDMCSAVLLTAAARTQAVSAIVNEVTKIYSEAGANIYSGVTIDFEGMKGSALKEGFTAFLNELNTALDKLGKTLYVTVPPVTADGVYYDGYDYKAIGNAADEVILMAHDYNADTMDAVLVGTGFTATPLTPLEQVYYALREITDPDTGVADTSKIVLALSMDSVGWHMQNEKVIDAASVSLTPSEIYTKLTTAGAVMHYSERYQNPYITYNNTDGTSVLLWYEDARSVEAKIKLARLFGVTGVSVWRLGTIPTYDDDVKPLYFNIWSEILSER